MYEIFRALQRDRTSNGNLVDLLKMCQVGKWINMHMNMPHPHFSTCPRQPIEDVQLTNVSAITNDHQVSVANRVGCWGHQKGHGQKGMGSRPLHHLGLENVYAFTCWQEP